MVLNFKRVRWIGLFSIAVFLVHLHIGMYLPFGKLTVQVADKLANKSEVNRVVDSQVHRRRKDHQPQNAAHLEAVNTEYEKCKGQSKSRSSSSFFCLLKQSLTSAYPGPLGESMYLRSDLASTHARKKISFLTLSVEDLIGNDCLLKK